MTAAEVPVIHDPSFRVQSFESAGKSYVSIGSTLILDGGGQVSTSLILPLDGALELATQLQLAVAAANCTTPTFGGIATEAAK